MDKLEWFDSKWDPAYFIYKYVNPFLKRNEKKFERIFIKAIIAFMLLAILYFGIHYFLWVNA